MKTASFTKVFVRCFLLTAMTIVIGTLNTYGQAQNKNSGGNNPLVSAPGVTPILPDVSGKNSEKSVNEFLPTEIEVDGELLKASRIVGFVYSRSMARPTRYHGMQGMDSGMEMGGDMGMGGGTPGMDMGMGIGMGGLSAMGMPGADAGVGMASTPHFQIFAYIFDAMKLDNGRTRIEVRACYPQVFTGMYGMSGMGRNYGDDGGMGGGYGDEFGMGMRALPKLKPLAELSAAPVSPKSKSRPTPRSSSLSRDELELVETMVKLDVWKETAVNEVFQVRGELASKDEKALRDLLTEEYDSQLAMQQLELRRIEARTKELREELSRRQAAKDRVVAVQLGKLTLEAQGLLNRENP